MFTYSAGGTLLPLTDRTERIACRLFERDVGLKMMRLAEPLVKQPLGVGAGLAALALAGASAAAPDLAGLGATAVALPLAMVAYSVFAVTRGTAADRLSAVAIEAANDGLRRDIVGSLQALVSRVRTVQATEEHRYLDLVGSFVRGADSTALSGQGAIDARAELERA
jgi:hypothetical protein